MTEKGILKMEVMTLPDWNGGGHWTVPELLFESKELIPALHLLLTGDKMSDLRFR